eukprot:406396-Pelagomonas_calceolata.AAC.2
MERVERQECECMLCALAKLKLRVHPFEALCAWDPLVWSTDSHGPFLQPGHGVFDLDACARGGADALYHVAPLKVCAVSCCAQGR